MLLDIVHQSIIHQPQSILNLPKFSPTNIFYYTIVSQLICNGKNKLLVSYLFDAQQACFLINNNTI